MTSSRPPRRLSGPLAVALAGVLVVLLAALVAVAVFDLATWVALGRSWAQVEEIQGLLMIWFGLLGAAYALARGLHLSLELFVARLPAAARSAAGRLASAAVAAFGILLALTAGRLTAAVGNSLPATGWSAAWQYLPGAVAGILVAAIALEQMVWPPAPPEEDPGG